MLMDNTLVLSVHIKSVGPGARGPAVIQKKKLV